MEPLSHQKGERRDTSIESVLSSVVGQDSPLNTSHMPSRDSSPLQFPDSDSVQQNVEEQKPNPELLKIASGLVYSAAGVAVWGAGLMGYVGATMAEGLWSALAFVASGTALVMSFLCVSLARDLAREAADCKRE